MGKRIIYILVICILVVGLGIGYYLVVSNKKIVKYPVFQDHFLKLVMQTDTATF